MPLRPSCFISYAHAGADIDSISAIEANLKTFAEGKIDFYRDNRLKIGDSITEHERMLQTITSAILLLTPEYLQKIKNRTGGVYREFKIILQRLERAEERKRRIVAKPGSASKVNSLDHFVVFPILFSGSLDASCPEELKERLAGDFLQFRAHRNKNGKIFLTDQVKNKYNSVFEQIVGQIQFGFVSGTESFQHTYETLFNKLFLETKHELVDPSLPDAVKTEIYVKTRAYRQVKNQSAYILVGRKGSGKTTITKQLASEIGEGYFKSVDIYVDSFDLEYLFQLTLNPQLFSELRSLQPQVKLFRATWKVFVFLASMITIRNSLPSYFRLHLGRCA